MKSFLTNCTLLLMLLISGQIVAQDSSPLQVSGFADMYYQFNFNRNAPEVGLTSYTSFTETHNSFTLGMVNTVLSKEVGKVGFVADLAFGPRADAANGFSGTTFGPIKQLFITYSPIPKLTITAGNFSTYLGYEIIDAPGNANYSTSYLFSYGPFYHTGVKVDIALTDKLGFMAGVFNDTDDKFDLPGSEGKHFGAQLSISEGGLSAYLNYIGGTLGDPEEDSAHEIDLTATFQASDALMLGLNTAFTTAKISDDNNASWFGVAGYVNYTLNENVGLNLRGEFFADGDGLALGLGDVSIFDLTLSAPIKSGPLTFMPEFRMDIASEDIFLNKDGEPQSISPSIITALIYTF